MDTLLLHVSSFFSKVPLPSKHSQRASVSALILSECVVILTFVCTLAADASLFFTYLSMTTTVTTFFGPRLFVVLLITRFLVRCLALRSLKLFWGVFMGVFGWEILERR
jgi:hypothetical protein